eukprot:11208851-Lingulodinium_polyedra.AAC.1
MAPGPNIKTTSCIPLLGGSRPPPIVGPVGPLGLYFMILSRQLETPLGRGQESGGPKRTPTTLL